MSAIELTVPCVAAHLLVTPQPCPRDTNGDGDCGQRMCPNCGPDWTRARPMVLRFLPTDADTPGCPRCYGDGRGSSWWSTKDCPECNGSGRRPLRAGDRIAIRADDVEPRRLPTDVHGWQVTGAVFGGEDPPRYRLYRTRYEDKDIDYITLRPGDIAGYATVTNVLPIVDDILYAGPCVCSNGRTLWLHTPEGAVDLSDHLAAGLVFTPGQIALELTTA